MKIPQTFQSARTLTKSGLEILFRTERPARQPRPVCKREIEKCEAFCKIGHTQRIPTSKHVAKGHAENHVWQGQFCSVEKTLSRPRVHLNPTACQRFGSHASFANETLFTSSTTLSGAGYEFLWFCREPEALNEARGSAFGFVMVPQLR